MTEARAGEQAPPIGLHGVVELFEQYDELAKPYWEAAFLRGAIDHKLDGERINTVEDGYLISHSGNRFRLADDQEFAALEVAEQGARATVAEKLGIELEVFDDLRHFAKDISSDRSLRARDEEAGSDYVHEVRTPSYVTGQLSQPRSMDRFLEAFRVLADLSGETFEVDVMENVIPIGPGEPIEEIKGRLAASFRNDRTQWRFEQWNMWAAQRYEESPESWPQGIVRQLDVSEIEQILEDYPAPEPEEESGTPQ